MAEFGGSLVDGNAEAEVSMEEVDPDMSEMTGNEVEPEETQPQRQSTRNRDIVIGESLLYLIGPT